MKILTTIAMSAALTVPVVSAPNNQQIDVSSMTCQQFLQNDESKVSLIVIWFNGFYSQSQDPQIIDLSSINEARDRFVDFCKQQPNFKMTIAAEGLLSK
jgi:acid stress chaperone HdeB